MPGRMKGKRENREVLAAVLTAPGSGGIAVIEVRGSKAARTVDKVFRARSGADWLKDEGGKLQYGHVVDDNEAVVDEVIVRLIVRGRDERVEVNCHGGIVAAGAVMRLLVESGAAEVPAGDFAARAARNSGLDRVQAEAMQLLPLAETRLGVRVLCDQVNGALSGAIREIDVSVPDAVGKVQRLIESAALGLALTRPRRIAVVGRPNVGKSSLFNALVGHHRTIVSPVPGTTRDFVNEFIVLGGFPVELIDTAGLRRRGGMVEMRGVEATWRVVSEADLILFLLDGSRRVCRDEGAMIESLAPRRPIMVANKCDLGLRARLPEGKSEVDFCEVSALTGAGLSALEKLILRRFPDAAGCPPGTPVVFSDGQLLTLGEVRELCVSGCFVDARRRLRRLVGICHRGQGKMLQ